MLGMRRLLRRSLRLRWLLLIIFRLWWMSLLLLCVLLHLGRLLFHLGRLLLSLWRLLLNVAWRLVITC